jgi:hypothetical protein
MIIEIDFEVFKALTIKRTDESVSYNDVLREELGLSKVAEVSIQPTISASNNDWVTKDTTFPSGTEFRAKYKGALYSAKVEDGALTLNGNRFDTPSAAAVSITNNPVNGWTFWECRIPGGYWESISSIRKRQKSSLESMLN